MAKRAFTLIEMLMTLALLFALVIVSVYIFRAVLLSWSSGETRSGADIILDSGIARLDRDLRPAKAAQSSNDEIRFTKDGASYYIYYFYNALDPYPLSFNQSLYQVKKAALSGGISGTFTYGSGDLILTDVLPPPSSDLSMAANTVNIDFSVKRRDETVRARAEVRPRNI